MGACASKPTTTTQVVSGNTDFDDFEDVDDDVVKEGGLRIDDDVEDDDDDDDAKDEIEIEIELAKREEEAFVLVRTKDAATKKNVDDANDANTTTTTFTGGGGRGGGERSMTKREEGEESFFAGFQQRAAAKEKDPAGRKEEEEEEEERRVSVSSTSPASGATKSSAESGRSVGERHRSVRPRRERGRGSGGQTDGINARDEQKWRRSPRVRSPNNNNNNNNEGHHDHDYHHHYHHQQQQQQRNRQPHQNRTARRQNSFSRLSSHPSPRQTQATTPTGQYVNANHGTKHKRISSRGSWHDGLSNFSDENGMRSFFGAPVSSGPPKKWSIGDTLGEGSYGRVNLALNGETGELFALKEVKIAGCNTRDANNKDFEDTHHHHHQTLEITKDGKRSTRSSLDGGLITPTVQDPRLRESIVQLQQEVHMLSQLTHPNIVRYIGIKRQKDILNVFMEYVPGGSIASLLQRFGPLGDSVTRVYTRQILIGLDYLHSQRVVHRDIKGANILVEKSGRIKLADFGMAKMLEFVDIERNNHAKKAIKGSAYWMAPEVIRKSEVTLGCDVWSVGCTVIEMASAKPPWCECSTQVQAMYKIASSTALPTLPENNLSADAKAFILHCLKRNVEERPDVQTLLMNPFVDDSSNEKMYRAPALKYEQHDGSYSNFPDNQSLVSSHVSLEDPSEETDVDENDEDEDQRRRIRSDDDDDNSIYGGEDTDVDESSLHFGNNFNAYLSQSPRNNEGLTDPSILGVRRNIALKPLVVNSTRSRNEKAGSRTGSSSQQDAAGTSPKNNNNNNTNP